MAKKKYVQVGVGSRARFFYGAIASKYKETSEILAFCDINKTRMEYANNLLVNTYGYENQYQCIWQTSLTK